MSWLLLVELLFLLFTLFNFSQPSLATFVRLQQLKVAIGAARALCKSFASAVKLLHSSLCAKMLAKREEYGKRIS